MMHGYWLSKHDEIVRHKYWILYDLNISLISIYNLMQHDPLILVKTGSAPNLSICFNIYHFDTYIQTWNTVRQTCEEDSKTFAKSIGNSNKPLLVFIYNLSAMYLVWSNVSDCNSSHYSMIFRSTNNTSILHLYWAEF